MTELQETWESPRAKKEQELIRRRMGFEAVMALVDEGKLTLDQAIAGLQGIESEEHGDS